MSPSTIALLVCLFLVVALTFFWLRAERQVRFLKKKFSLLIPISEQMARLEKQAAKEVAAAKNEVGRAREAAASVQMETNQLRDKYSDKRMLLEQLEKQVAVYDERLAFAELGIYEPHFDYGDSKDYKTRIIEVRQHQKDLVSAKLATICPTDWTVDGSRSKGQTMVNRQMRLTMRAFNNECEAAIANVRWNNAEAMQRRILNSAKQIDAANTSMSLEISSDYIQLKLTELQLTHEYRECLKVEKDQRRELARAERDEKKLLAQAKAAELQEKKYQHLLAQARQEAGIDQSRIAVLEEALTEAHAQSERARAMAEMTKSGYVYIISNIGSFGEDVVKIGLTRRLDPDDRVRELGDASVPFGFDTHAIIYSEQAPALEAALHKEFSERRLNAANMRKEFFRVRLEEVEAAVQRLAPDANFFRDCEAQEWHETLSRRNQMLKDMKSAVDTFPQEI